MTRRSDRITVTMDNRPLEVEPGLTILQAARRHDIYVPTLCYHPDLTAFGGCRLCIVEVEGLNRFPTSCTTPVEDGMVIRTHTAQVQEVRAEILQLILSEHPASCLVCDERNECTSFVPTIRKAGITTGCRYCPSDGRCELQALAERLGVSEIRYPVSYRNLRVEKEDPFYDRDYNLCILCGRCVRMCQEVRAAGTLAFRERGSRTVIGPAFGRTHVEAGCEFCGACVEVCPTGALAEKARKWDGPAERDQVTTCALCGLGCQLRLQVKGEAVIGSLPAEGEPNHGQLCVKGRFCIPELVNHHRRLLLPQRTVGGTAVDESWANAVALAAERLASCPPGRVRILVSPDCTNETLYVAQKLARVAVGSEGVDTSARAFYGAGFDAYLRLLAMAVPLADLRRAQVVLSVGLDTRYDRSVVGVELRRAVDRGAKLLTLYPSRHSLAQIADLWLRPEPDATARMVSDLADLTEARAARAARSRSRPRGDLEAAAAMLARGERPVILVGPEVPRDPDSARLLGDLARLALAAGAGVVPLPAFSNLLGSVLMGAYAELRPGGCSSAVASLPGDGVEVLYLIGEAAHESTPRPAFVIMQNIYPPDPCTAADLALPAAAFSEEDGSVLSGEGRVLRRRRTVDPPGLALPDWEILCRVARAMGAPGFDFQSVAEIHAEIASLVPGFSDFEEPSTDPVPFRCDATLERPVAGPCPNEHSYRGFALESRVAGAGVLFADAGTISRPLGA